MDRDPPRQRQVADLLAAEALDDHRVGPVLEQPKHALVDGADKAHPAPAILTTNGFGGSKDGQAAMARAYAKRGYVVLSYSGLGFGGSTCKITLDDRDYDGKAGSRLITFLGGGKAATDGTTIDYVRRDKQARDGKVHDIDVRVSQKGLKPRAKKSYTAPRT